MCRGSSTIIFSFEDSIILSQYSLGTIFSVHFSSSQWTVYFISRFIQKIVIVNGNRAQGLTAMRKSTIKRLLIHFWTGWLSYNFAYSWCCTLVSNDNICSYSALIPWLFGFPHSSINENTESARILKNCILNCDCIESVKRFNKSRISPRRSTECFDESLFNTPFVAGF